MCVATTHPAASAPAIAWLAVTSRSTLYASSSFVTASSSRVIAFIGGEYHVGRGSHPGRRDRRGRSKPGALGSVSAPLTYARPIRATMLSNSRRPTFLLDVDLSILASTRMAEIKRHTFLDDGRVYGR